MKYKINNLIINAKSPVEATKIAKLFSKCKDSVKDAKNYKIYQQTPFGTFFITTWEHNSPEEAVKEFLEYNPAYKSRGTIIAKDSVKDNCTKDEAYDRSTIEALISDEKAAIDAYNVAIANLDGKIPDLGIKVLQSIRDDEQKHVENLYSILTGNITEKNLKDNINDSKVNDDIVNEIPSALDTAKQYAKNANYQAVANICWDIATRLKRMKLADANDLNTADKIIMATEIVRKVMFGAGPRDYGGTIGYKVYPNEISKVIDLLKRQFPNIKVKKHVNGISGEIEILKNSLN